MARILIAITGLTGIRNASFELARRLETAGHEVVVTAPRELAAAYAGLDLQFQALPPIDEQPEPPLPAFRGAFRPMRRLLYRYAHYRSRKAAALAATDPTAFRKLLDVIRPDLLLCDVELHEYIFVAYGRGQRLALLSQWYSLWDRPGLPYQLTDLHLGELQHYDEEITEATLEENWAEVRKTRRRRALKLAWLSGGTDRRSVLLRLADREGFPRRYIRKNFWPGPFTYEGLPVLAMVPWEMELPHDPPDFLHYVGPMVRADRPEPDPVSTGGLTVTEVVERAREHNHKLIVSTVTTMPGVTDDFTARLVTAVAERPDWELIVGTGNDGPPPAELPDNVHAFSYVPQLRALAAADLSINHGGIHTVHEALHFGVPQLVYYALRSDQPGVAVRVHHHGVGVRVERGRDDAAGIRLMIDFMLGAAEKKAAAAAMCDHGARYRAVRTVEQLVGRLLRDEKQN